MTNRIDDAFDEITAGLMGALGDSVRIYRDGTQPVAPPGIVIGPPQIDWQGMDNGITGLTFTLYLVTSSDSRMMSRLFDLVEAVSDAIWDHVDSAAVTQAVPSSWPINDTTSLPCYQFTVEMSL